jgi:hypothetical protein
MAKYITLNERLNESTESKIENIDENKKTDDAMWKITSFIHNETESFSESDIKKLRNDLISWAKNEFGQ